VDLAAFEFSTARTDSEWYAINKERSCDHCDIQLKVGTSNALWSKVITSTTAGIPWSSLWGVVLSEVWLQKPAFDGAVEKLKNQFSADFGEFVFIKDIENVLADINSSMENLHLPRLQDSPFTEGNPTCSSSAVQDNVDKLTDNIDELISKLSETVNRAKEADIAAHNELRGLVAHTVLQLLPSIIAFTRVVSVRKLESPADLDEAEPRKRQQTFIRDFCGYNLDLMEKRFENLKDIHRTAYGLARRWTFQDCHEAKEPSAKNDFKPTTAVPGRCHKDQFTRFKWCTGPPSFCGWVYRCGTASQFVEKPPSLLENPTLVCHKLQQKLEFQFDLTFKPGSSTVSVDGPNEISKQLRYFEQVILDLKGRTDIYGTNYCYTRMAFQAEGVFFPAKYYFAALKLPGCLDKSGGFNKFLTCVALVEEKAATGAGNNRDYCGEIYARKNALSTREVYNSYYFQAPKLPTTEVMPKEPSYMFYIHNDLRRCHFKATIGKNCEQFGPCPAICGTGGACIENFGDSPVPWPVCVDGVNTASGARRCWRTTYKYHYRDEYDKKWFTKLCRRHVKTCKAQWNAKSRKCEPNWNNCFNVHSYTVKRERGCTGGDIPPPKNPNSIFQFEKDPEIHLSSCPSQNGLSLSALAVGMSTLTLATIL
jgi:hypothetical protein